MDFTADWRSLWPISSTFSPPLLRYPAQITKQPLGPLVFTPNNESTTSILQSPSLATHLTPPYPDLTLSRFLRSYTSAPHSLLTPYLDANFTHNHDSHFNGFNSMQLLQVSGRDLVVLFFPTGENRDRVGFCVVSVKDGILDTRHGSVRVIEEGSVGFRRITRLLVNDVDGFADWDDGVVGFLMVCTDYSISWYMVKIGGSGGVDVCVDYLGGVDAMALRGRVVVGECWSSFFREECLVLVENGELLLFDVTGKNVVGGKSTGLIGEKSRSVKVMLRILLNDMAKLEENGDALGWFGCEFSWHPRVFVVSCKGAVFLVDSRPSDCSVSCLLKIGMLSMGKNDGFLVLSRATDDGFFFSVATRSLLLLCDVRKPFMPVLRWTHRLQNPRYMIFFKLSNLRANAQDAQYKWASELGSCILLGSFWDNEFSLFCYGPDENGSGTVFSEISKFCNSYYAWGLPSKLSLLGVDCNCGSCLTIEEFSKVSLPIWIDWRHKKDVVMGFGILNADLSAKLFPPNSFGGFALIRLTSSGRLEAQQYIARHKLENISIVGHKRKNIISEENIFYDSNNQEYDGAKKYQYLKLECLMSYLKDNLANYIFDRKAKRKGSNGHHRSKCFKKPETKYNFHQKNCQKLKGFGLRRMRSSLAISDILEDISLPTSLQEIALQSNYVDMPTKLLQLAFSTYSDFNLDPANHKEPLEFLNVPDHFQIPPFPFRDPSHRSNKWSSNVRPPENLVGPILPPHFVTILYKVCREESQNAKEVYAEESDELSAHSQFKLQCAKVKAAIEEHNLRSGGKNPDEDFVSLGDDDTNDMISVENELKFAFHRPSFLENSVTSGVEEPGIENEMFFTHVFKSREVESDISADTGVQELFDIGCPVELKFHSFTSDLGSKELEAFRKLKKHELEFQRSFKPYQDYVSRGKV